MSAIVHARVTENLVRLRLGHVAERLDAVLGEAARSEPTYLDFLDALLGQEVTSKRHKRIAMGMKIAHFPSVRTLDEFDFKFQPSVDQLAGPPLATQFGVPLLLALDDCEVARRKNQLSREQLYTAELEHWAADRARAVLVPDVSVEGALREHYKLTSTLVVATWAAGLRRPAANDAARLLRQLAIEAPFVLVLGRDVGDDERRAVLEGAPSRAIVLAERGLWIRGADGSIACVHDRPVAGPALGALIASAEVVVGTAADVRWYEAQTLASRVALVSDGASLERTLLDAAAPRPLPGSTALLEDFLAHLPGRATSPKEGQVAHGLR